MAFPTKDKIFCSGWIMKSISQETRVSGFGVNRTPEFFSSIKDHHHGERSLHSCAINSTFK